MTITIMFNFLSLDVNPHFVQEYLASHARAGGHSLDLSSGAVGVSEVVLGRGGLSHKERRHPALNASW